jgi:ADP-ribose pyrophosphatase YjhB (NUDIX family)
VKPAQQIALWADQLRDLSASGLEHSPSIYNKNRYHAVQNIAMAMLAFSAGETLEQIEPLRGTIFSRPTPLTGGDAAIIDDNGRILLVQRSDNSKWAMPGGAMEVGETPIEGVQRETWEETGIHCRVVAAVGVFDSRFCNTQNPHHLYRFVFLCKPLSVERDRPTHANEVLKVGWFAENNLPADLDPGHKLLIPETFRVWHGDNRIFFDGITEG